MKKLFRSINSITPKDRDMLQNAFYLLFLMPVLRKLLMLPGQVQHCIFALNYTNHDNAQNYLQPHCRMLI